MSEPPPKRRQLANQHVHGWHNPKPSSSSTAASDGTLLSDDPRLGRVQFVTLCNVDIPLDVMKIVLSYVRNGQIVKGFGCASRDCYGAVLQTWERLKIRAVRPNCVPKLALQTIREVFLAGFTEEGITHLLGQLNRAILTSLTLSGHIADYKASQYLPKVLSTSGEFPMLETIGFTVYPSCSYYFKDVLSFATIAPNLRKVANFPPSCSHGLKFLQSMEIGYHPESIKESVEAGHFPSSLTELKYDTEEYDDEASHLPLVRMIPEQITSLILDGADWNLFRWKFEGLTHVVRLKGMLSLKNAEDVVTQLPALKSLDLALYVRDGRTFMDGGGYEDYGDPTAMPALDMNCIPLLDKLIGFAKTSLNFMKLRDGMVPNVSLVFERGKELRFNGVCCRQRSNFCFCASFERAAPVLLEFVPRFVYFHELIDHSRFVSCRKYKAGFAYVKKLGFALVEQRTHKPSKRYGKRLQIYQK